jgi:hypothetical protein
MLFSILKLFGLDVPAKLEAVKASVEQHVEAATDWVKAAAQLAALVAALSTFAAITGAMAFGIGLVAIYLWTADRYGPYAGLAVVGAILTVATIALASAAASKAKSLAPSAPNPHHAATTSAASNPDPIEEDVSHLNVSHLAAVETQSRLAASPPIALAASASDLVEPLALVLSKVVNYPRVGNLLADELIGHLRTTAHGATGEAIERAANVVRQGDRTNLVLVLTGATLMGWLLAHHSQQA